MAKIFSKFQLLGLGRLFAFNYPIENRVSEVCTRSSFVRFFWGISGDFSRSDAQNRSRLLNRADWHSGTNGQTEIGSVQPNRESRKQRFSAPSALRLVVHFLYKWPCIFPWYFILIWSLHAFYVIRSVTSIAYRRYR